MAGPESAVLRRAPFVSRNVWVTPHSDRQRYPAGEYVMQAARCQGLSVWTARDEPLAARALSLFRTGAACPSLALADAPCCESRARLRR